LIKGAESLELAYKVQTIVFDKNSTLTQAKNRLLLTLLLYGTANSNELKLLRLAAAVERSEHPLVEAVVTMPAQQDVGEVQNFEAIAGSV